jgi:hypothetical protein
MSSLSVSSSLLSITLPLFPRVVHCPLPFCTVLPPLITSRLQPFLSVLRNRFPVPIFKGTLNSTIKCTILEIMTSTKYRE